MTNLEKQIITALAEDSRLGADKLALMLGIDEQEAAKAVRKLEDEGVLVKYTVIVNPDTAEDDTVEALIEVKVTPQKGSGFDAIAQEVASYEEVKNLYLMSGGYDLAVIVEGKSLKSVSRFVSERISTLDGVLSTATHFILKKYKVEGAQMSGEKTAPRLSVHP